MLGTAGMQAAADQVLCFLPDTLIATPHGEVKVQALRVGDLVCTASGAARPVVWIGEGRVLAPHGRRSAATPVSYAAVHWHPVCRTTTCT